ncbi:hypothetical protein YK48G_25590 [Lentilactobacillus fungorum]|uniref:MucBP domain-containing protein n=1 Tax=Lentilactobacillus fungorum TaxID=2201250 RepID=A0ABQ3W3T2_9LACO|nr:MucBP domain-containing protein [Lentilactobacillus fungorum]GHP15134.1 hypothetical protein YK48G_25590 [Lentilactobacillus fungorum]
MKKWLILSFVTFGLTSQFGQIMAGADLKQASQSAETKNAYAGTLSASDSAIMTVTFMDENGRQLKKDWVNHYKKINSTYTLVNGPDFRIPGYEVVNKKDLEGKVLTPNHHVTLRYRPIGTASKAEGSKPDTQTKLTKQPDLIKNGQEPGLTVNVGLNQASGLPEDANQPTSPAVQPTAVIGNQSTNVINQFTSQPAPTTVPGSPQLVAKTSEPADAKAISNEKLPVSNLTIDHKRLIPITATQKTGSIVNSSHRIIPAKPVPEGPSAEPLRLSNPSNGTSVAVLANQSGQQFERQLPPLANRQMKATIRLIGVGPHSKQLFTKLATVSDTELKRLLNENIQFAGYDWQHSTYRQETNTIVAHYIPKMIPIKVIAIDSSGHRLSNKVIQVAFGAKQTIKPVSIKGYVTHDHSKTLIMNHLVPTTIKFHYQKRPGARTKANLARKIKHAPSQNKASGKAVRLHAKRASLKNDLVSDGQSKSRAQAKAKAGRLPQTGDTQADQLGILGFLMLVCLIAQKFIKRIS